MEEATTQWKLGRVEAKARKDGLEVNGRTISWEEIEAARQEVAPSAFTIQYIGTAE